MFMLKLRLCLFIIGISYATTETTFYTTSLFTIRGGGGDADELVSSDATQINSTSLSTTKSTGKKKFFLFRILSRRRKKRLLRTHTRRFTNKMNEKLEDARRMFLDRMAAVSFRLINYENDATMDNGTLFELDGGDDDDITPQSDLTLPNRSIYVVTTAALPWFTGTAVNPLLRAAYLSRRVRDINNQINAGEHNNNQTTLDENINNQTTVDEQLHASNSTNSNNSDPIRQMVTLVIPWLELEEDRLELYGPDMIFANQQEQEQYIRNWLRTDALMEDAADAESGLKIIFYPARYHDGLKSIFAMGDICAVLRNQTDDNDLADAVCILEEPEHLNWYRAPGEGWTKVFSYVVGILHTNYIEYAGTQFHGLWTAPAVQVMSSAMVRAYCHKVIKLSGVLQIYAPEKESIENVHGVREDFINEGRRRSLNSQTENRDLTLNEEVQRQVYFIGKILWAKGFEQMLELEEFYRELTGHYFRIDIYGSGPEQDEIKRAFLGRKQRKKRTRAETTDESNDLEELQSLSHEFIAKSLQTIKLKSQELKTFPKTLYEWRRHPIPAKFLGRVDHASLGKYKVFVNPSVSEVLCTTTFEALAMGKFVIIPVHESNKFFLQFPNCLGYRDKWEFAANLRWALTHEPEPLTQELANQFTWEAATDRLIQSSKITRREAREMIGKAKLDQRIAFLHQEMGKGATGDALRKFLGGGPISAQFKYELAKQGLDEEGSENEGLTQKLAQSSFVRAIKKSLSSSLEGDAYFKT